ncbi:PREDICTED: glutamate receptor 3.6-like [Ipomoea nil]|uniref:glutamate receptor 3.6-like n=1 Tax=Ipomoea nil TaxID=35883 RepID=UPI000900BE05|nr:PREDICTED: glutamate receptor 3.6-like [Ipomoea nil]
MKVFWALILAVLYCGYLPQGQGVNSILSARPRVVNIGCILTLRSPVGKITKLVIETAVEDINSNPAVLGGTKLNITFLDNNSNGLLGIIEAIHYMGTDTVAIIGPQSSVIAHAISHIANEIHVPLLSFSATDPALSSLQYPFFVRTSPNDMFQMAAIASIVEYYNWKAVIAIYVDDEYGRSGIAALSDQLAMRRCRISCKAPLKPRATLEEVRDTLSQLALTESRIIVVHTYPYRGLDIFSQAKSLGMTESGYVWIATHWLSTIFDTIGPLSPDVMDNIQGTITLRTYVPDSEGKRKFVSRWSDLAKRINDSNTTLGMCTYGLYAYDTVWLLARALDAFFKQGGNISFSIDPREDFNLYSMNVFDGGKLLVDSILKTNITGVTGLFKFTSDRELYRPAFEVINVIGSGMRRVGYWSNDSGLSVVHPDSLDSYPSSRLPSQKLYPVVWTGETVQKPRGWVFPNSGRPLNIGVSIQAGLNEFVEQIPGTDMFQGYCIEVFTTALNYLPYAVPYKFVPFGESNNTQLLRQITQGVYDAGVGIITITTSRIEMVDFTQPYMESGLVVVAPFRESGSSAYWAFLRPFTPTMWCVTGMFFLLIGAAIWILEHRMNDDFRGPRRKQIEIIVWFGFLTFFSANKENTFRIVSSLGRLVLMVWLFVVLIINSSYTANLTSILMAQHLSSPIKGIESLLTTNDPIGYHRGSIARDYMIQELHIHESRLVPFNGIQDFAKALRNGPKKGGVVAVVGYRAYMELFLSTHCEFCIVGDEFTRNGWGFAFPKDSPLAVDMSTAILELSENGELQMIHDKWLLGRACMSQNTKLQVKQFEVKSFLGLFLMCGFACLLALLLHFIMAIRHLITSS